MTKSYEALPQIAKIIIQLLLGSIVGGIYRICRFLETKKTATLVVGILCLSPPVSFVAWIIDLVTEITSNKITVFAD